MGQLQDLDAWVKGQIATIPPDKRKLVTDHQELGYYTDRYGLQQTGAVIPSFSSLAEPSAQQTAALEDAVRQTGVKVLFVDATVNPSLAQRIAQDTGAKLVTLTIGSLGPQSSSSATYLDYVRFITSTIVQSLSQG
jgi:manganese/iron transport system substrate-binding protein